MSDAPINEDEPNPNYTDSQRRHAKTELFRLRQERVSLEERFQNCLNMAPELLEPVTVNS